jgi:DNA-binding response OmpR family regulator
MATDNSPSGFEKKMNLQNFFKDKRVLIIEDDAFLGSILYRYMTDMKISVDLATTGEGAIEAIDKIVPSIIILDIFLPGINGLDLLETMRKNKISQNIPVLVVSNTDQQKDRERAQRLGAEIVLKAMVTPANILEKLYQILSKNNAV